MTLDVFEVDGFVNDKAQIFHGFFGRQGGVSKGIYASLNCGPGSNDNPAHVIENRRRVASMAGCDELALLSLHQVHGNYCFTVTEPYEAHDKPEADAYVTDRAGIALGILTADCTPILFHGVKDDGSAVIGAAHAGWGGALKGVSESTVKAMVSLGVKLESIVAAIGPCIAQVSYEVHEDFAAPFLDEDDINERFFKSARRDGHLMFDLAGYNAFKLSKAGVKNVLIKDIDTYFNEEDFFSYRRATHRNEKDYGRQISVIKIN